MADGPETYRERGRSPEDGRGRGDGRLHDGLLLDGRLREPPVRGDPPSSGTSSDGWDGDAARAATRARKLAAGPDGGSAFLAEASRLLADSLDYETTLATVAGLALPQLGAWCFVDVTEPDGALRRLAVVHPEPEKQALARRLESHWPPQRDDPFGVPRVMRTLRSEIIPRVTDAMLESFARNEENLDSLKALGMGSLLVVPLAARGEVLGAVTFVSPADGCAFDDSDLVLAEDLAARSAIALDNARLHRATEEALEEAERANQAKSVFLTTMSHELRTPINAVVGYADLLEMEIPGPITDKQREQIERIQASSRHLLGLVTEVLDLAKVEAGEMTVRRERGVLDEAILPALGMVEPQARLHGIALENASAGGCAVEYVGDEDRVRQIITNLVSNAVKFTLPGGGVAVRCGMTHRPGADARLSGGGPWAWVEVKDDGIGIAEEDQAHVFEPFTQVRNGLTREVGGTGLGLTVSRQMARLMGGDLTMESALGEGSRFTLWLPTGQVPASLPADDPKKVARRRDSRALGRASSRLLGRLDEVLHDVERRLAREIPAAATAPSPASLRDHLGTLLADIAQSIAVLADDPDVHAHLLRDGSKVQRLVAELHGNQRQRLGWSEADARREFEIVAEEVAAVLRDVDGTVPEDGDAEHAVGIARRFLDQAERVSRQAFRTATAAQAM